MECFGSGNLSDLLFPAVLTTAPGSIGTAFSFSIKKVLRTKEISHWIALDFKIRYI